MCKFHKVTLDAGIAFSTGPAVTADEWAFLVRRAKLAADLPSSVLVRCFRDFNLAPDYFGVCILHSPRSISVRIAGQLPAWHVVEILLHEMSHARQFFLYGPEISEHGPEWGREYSTVYCRWMGESDTLRPIVVT